MNNELIYGATDRRDGRIETNQLADEAVTERKLSKDLVDKINGSGGGW